MSEQESCLHELFPRAKRKKTKSSREENKINGFIFYPADAKEASVATSADLSAQRSTTKSFSCIFNGAVVKISTRREKKQVSTSEYRGKLAFSLLSEAETQQS